MTSQNASRIKCVSLDVGYTLIYTDPPVGHVYTEIAAKFGYRLNPYTVQDRFLKTWTRMNRLKEKLRGGKNPLADEEKSYVWWKGVFKQAVGDEVNPQDFELMFDLCFHEYARGKYWKVFPEVKPVLRELILKGKTLVVLSNWDLRLLQILQELELNDFFQNIYISTVIGFAKPDPKAFKKIAQDLNIVSNEIIHVGDSWEEDVLGALKAGCQAAYLSRSMDSQKSVGIKVPVISSLQGLAELF